jgi:endoglucanase
MRRGVVALVLATVSALPVVTLVGCAPGSPSPLSTGVARRADTLLASTWQGYKRRFLNADGRVVDPKRGNASTSEGQSYAMLRAAWMDDRQAFAAAWRWTQDNLRSQDHLFGYLWGRRGDGSWGLLDPHSAADADQDIALALLTAAHRWGDEQYRAAAGTVVAAIWDNEVAHLGGVPYLAAGNWATTTAGGATVNPSYFAPYAYRLFADVDGAHPWHDVVDSSYRALDACTAAPLSTGRSAGLPPNWCLLTRDGAAHPATAMPDADDYGYDAFRVMWRLALDHAWNGEERAADYLRRADLLRTQWSQGHRLAAVYHHDGSVAADNEDVAVYGGDLGNLLVADPAAAAHLVGDKLVAAVGHHDGEAFFGDPDNYYQQNWAWFGLALAAGRVTAPQA